MDLEQWKKSPFCYSNRHLSGLHLFFAQAIHNLPHPRYKALGYITGDDTCRARYCHCQCIQRSFGALLMMFRITHVARSKLNAVWVFRDRRDRTTVATILLLLIPLHRHHTYKPTFPLSLAPSSPLMSLWAAKSRPRRPTPGRALSPWPSRPYYLLPPRKIHQHRARPRTNRAKRYYDVILSSFDSMWVHGKCVAWVGSQVLEDIMMVW